PAVDHLDHFDAPLAQLEPPGRLLATVAGVAFDANVHAARLAEGNGAVNPVLAAIALVEPRARGRRCDTLRGWQATPRRTTTFSSAWSRTSIAPSFAASGGA